MPSRSPAASTRSSRDWVSRNRRRVHLFRASASLANALYSRGVGERDDGLRDAPLKVLLAGNSSKLPLVKSAFCEIFEIGEDKLVFQADRLKTAVAQGACEDESLRRDLGDQGLIQWETVGAVDRLPFSIGLYSPDLKGLSQYEDGFIPVFKRGTSPGDDEGTFAASHDEGVPLQEVADGCFVVAGV